MKKIKYMLMLLMFLMILPLFNLKEVKAITETEFDFVQEWEIYNYFTTVYGFRINQYEFPDLAGGNFVMEFDIPQSDYNINTIGGIQSYLVLSDDIGVVYSIPLIDLFADDMFGTIYLDFSENRIISNRFAYVISEDLSTVNELSINVMMDFTSIPSQFYEYWMLNCVSILTIEAFVVKFYTYIDYLGGLTLSLHDIQFVFNNIPNIPSNPSPPSVYDGYVFIGWRYWDIQEQEMAVYYFDKIIDESITGEDGIIEFYAIFTDFVVVGDITEITGNLPPKLSIFLEGIGFNNIKGYMILYVLLHLLIMGYMVFKKKLLNMGIFFSILITVLFMYFGMLSMFVIIVMILFYIIMLLSNVNFIRHEDVNINEE